MTGLRRSAARRPLVWGPVVVERVRRRLLVDARRIGPSKELMAMRDALLVSLMEMTGCRPGEALALRWRDIGERIAIERALSGREIGERTKTGVGRSVPVLRPLRSDLAALRERSGASADDYVFSALMLASGTTLQRLARIQGHSIRVLDQTYSEQLIEFEDHDRRIDPVVEIEKARALVWEGEMPLAGGSEAEKSIMPAATMMAVIDEAG